LYTREDLEEERRLFYVAITRAEKHLFISFANTRYKFGSLQFSEPSRFLKELPSEGITLMGASERKQSSSLFNTDSSSESGLQKRNLQPRRAKLIRRPNAQIDNENFTADDLSNLRAGNEVMHQRFGKGKVLAIAEGTNSIATIAFENEGEKKIMLKFAKLKILS